MAVTILFYPSSDSASVFDNDDGSSSKPASPARTRNGGDASPPRTYLDFEAAFPSILKTAVRLRDARDNNTIPAFKAIAEVFIMCAKSAIHEIHRTRVGSHTDGSYELAKSAAELVVSLMHGKVKTDIEDIVAIDMVLNLADMLIGNLKELTTVALRIKPLPVVPREPLAEADGLSDQTSVVEHRLSFFDYELIDSDVYEESYGSSSHRFLFGNRMRGLFSSTRSASSSEHLSSSATLADNGSQSALSGSTMASRKDQNSKRLHDVPSVLRQSAYFLPSDQAAFQFDVDAPLPRQDRGSVQFNEAGEVKGASFSALVHTLTSKNAVLDPDLTPTFFAGFRIFGSAKLFLEEIQKRFDEEAPDDIGTAQLRVWTREAFLTRLRVGKILLLWLVDYWQPDYDDGVLGHLHQFAVERIRNELPKSLSTPILEMIDSRLTGDEIYVTSHKDRYFKILASQVVQTKIAVTGFSYPDTFGDDIDKVLLFFNTDIGKEEFTQQLTAMASAMFRKVNPQDVVLHWHEHSDNELGPALSEATSFARSFAMFVTHTIVSQQEKASRCRRIEFWISIATICLHHRNYFASHCAFTGITHSAINRLKRTILDLPIQAKAQFRRLDRFFAGYLNHAHVRKAMADQTIATLPLLVPLKRDIVSIKHVQPTLESRGAAGKSKNLINLVPYRILMKTMRAMESSLIPYGFAKNTKFEEWLNKVLKRYPADDEQILCHSFYEESRRTEPRNNELEWLGNTWTSYEIVKQGKKTIQSLPPDEDLPIHEGATRRRRVKSFRSLVDALKRQRQPSPTEPTLSFFG